MFIKKNRVGVLMVIIGLVLVVNLLIGTSLKSEKETTEEETAMETEEELDENASAKTIYRSPSFPLSISFAGEVFPLDDFEVRERLDRELIINNYRHSSTIRYIKLSRRWFPVIERILYEQGVPEDFKFLCVAESGLDNVISPAGATGFWQFMKSAGTSYGLTINKEVDERYHVEKATEAACKYLKDSKNRFGSWTAAAAAYNMGNGGLRKAMDQQKVSDYYDLKLNSETSRYVARITALKEVMTKPGLFGFDIKDDECYQPLRFSLLEVDSSIADLAQFALDLGTNYKMLKLYNPWLRTNTLTITGGKKYTLKLPV